MSEDKKDKKKKPKLKEVDLYIQQLQMYEQMPEQIMAINGWSKEELNVEAEELRNKIKLSKQGKASRRKGANYENTVAKIIKRFWGITLVRTPLSGGFQKSSKTEDFRGDLNCIEPGKRFLLHPECKNHKQWSVGKWWKQTEEDCPEGKIPILVMHRLQKIKEGKVVDKAEDFVMLKLEDFLRIANTEKIIEEKEVKKNETKRNRSGTRKSTKGIKKTIRNRTGTKTL